MVDQSKYALRGVSASKSEVHQAIKKLDKGIYPSAFCKILPDIVGGDENYCNIMLIQIARDPDPDHVRSGVGRILN